MNEESCKFAVTADIHGNYEALTAVLRDIEQRQIVDHIICLGDIVGYGPDPGACLDLIRDKADVILAGNHDLAISSPEILSQMNPEPQTVIRWTRQRLNAEQTGFLSNLPLEVKKGSYHFVHGSPVEPSGFEYIFSISSAKRAFLNSKSDFIFVGHSHIPRTFIEIEYKRMFAGLTHQVQSYEGSKIDLVSPKRYLINVGSVGQPRDGNPRAAYGLFDKKAHRFELVRVAYDIDAVIAKMRLHDLPDSLGQRLKDGK